MKLARRAFCREPSDHSKRHHRGQSGTTGSCLRHELSETPIHEKVAKTTIGTGIPSREEDVASAPLPPDQIFKKNSTTQKEGVARRMDTIAFRLARWFSAGVPDAIRPSGEKQSPRAGAGTCRRRSTSSPHSREHVRELHKDVHCTARPSWFGEKYTN